MSNPILGGQRKRKQQNRSRCAKPIPIGQHVPNHVHLVLATVVLPIVVHPFGDLSSRNRTNWPPKTNCATLVALTKPGLQFWMACLALGNIFFAKFAQGWPIIAPTLGHASGPQIVPFASGQFAPFVPRRGPTLLRTNKSISAHLPDHTQAPGTAGACSLTVVHLVTSWAPLVPKIGMG